MTNRRTSRSTKSDGPTSGKRAKERGTAARRERRRPIWRIIGWSTLGIGGAVVAVGGAAVGYAASMLKGLPAVSPANFTQMSVPSVVYDKNGKVIGKFTADGDRQPISSLKDVTPYLSNSFVAAEDKTFWTNIGINPLAIGRAFAQDLLHHQIVSGASTITQQTVKLALFPEQQRTTQRKVQEIALALEVNHMLTKDEILTDYMNWVYMGRMGGQNVYGVSAASQILFGKNAKDLTLPESAFLAAIPNNASIFSPYDHPQNTVKREHYILDQMLLDGMISQSEHDAAMKVDVTKLINKKPPQDSTPYPYVLRDNVEPLIAQYLVQQGKYDTTEEALAALPTAGYKIYTTIDLNAQEDIDKVLKNQNLFKGTTTTALDANGNAIKGKDGKPLPDLYEAGVTLIDNQSGGILAIGGGRDFASGAYVDHSDIPRQPGSSIKPLLDYGPAIDLHQLTAASPLWDAPVSFPDGAGGTWKPKDDENYWSGIVTARLALTESLNVPAIRILNQIGPATAWKYPEKMGITPQSKTLTGQATLTTADTQQLSSAIGGIQNGLTVQQMTSAYTVFPNQGVYRPAYMIQKIVDKDDNTLYQHQQTAVPVFSPQTAYVMTSILRDVVQKGTAYSIGSYFPHNYYIYGKTGTTDNRKDGWFVGYTNKYTMGIWMGYDYHESIDPNIYNMKFELWNQMMAPLLAKSPPTQAQPQPPGIVTVKVSAKSGMLPSPLDNDVYPEIFIQGTEPTTVGKVRVLAMYTIYNGQKYLATTNTPPDEVKQGVFLVPPGTLPPGVTTLDSKDYLPTSPDPRGGTVLQGSSVPGGGGSGQTASAGSPTNVQASVSNNAVTLQWSPVDGAASYAVWRATSVNGPYVNIGNPTDTSFIDTAPPSGKVFYEVYAVSDQGLSPPSQPVSVDVPASSGHSGQGNSTGNTTGLPDILWPSILDNRSRLP